MKNIAIEFIEIIENHGFKAYIVGGFVRDYLMNIKSTDIDITTSATPKEIKEIFPNVKFPKVINDDDSYGSVRVVYKNILFGYCVKINVIYLIATYISSQKALKRHDVDDRKKAG